MKAIRCSLLTIHTVIKQCSHSSRRCICNSTLNFKTATEEPVVSINTFSSDMKRYIEKCGLGDEISSLPKIFTKRSNICKNFVMVDPKVAKKIGYTICSRLSGECVLEFDAGFGLVSNVLMHATQNIRLYVNYRSLMNYLENKFGNELNKSVRVFDKSFPNMLAMLFNDEPIIEEFQEIVDGLPQKPWGEDICISLITPITKLTYMKGFLDNLVIENTWKQFGRPEFFFLLPHHLGKRLIFQEECNNRYILDHFLFNTFFDSQVLLDDIPREAFLPWPKVMKNKDKKIENVNETAFDNMFLIHAVPKIERFEPQVNGNFLSVLITFMRTAIRPGKRIIPSFESLVPFCGSQLILEDDLTVYTEFVEVSPDKFYHLFRKISEYPEFDAKMIDKQEITSYDSNTIAPDDTQD